MKPSGIPWLGDVPEGWEIDKIKHHLRISSERNPGDATVLSLYREYGVIPKDSRDDNHNVTSEDTSKYRYVREGDFAINKMKAWQGSMAVSGYEGIVSPAYYVYRFDSSRLEAKYFHHLIRTRGYASEFRRLSTGVREGQWDLHPIDFENTRIILPPLPEQRAIAERIDCEVARVDALRENIKSEIERLGDYKKSLIAETVTRGLRKRKMNPSGIPWLGDVPEGWEVTRIGYLATRKQPKYAPEEELLSVFLDRGVIRFADGGSKRANVASGDFTKYQLVEPGDFVLNNQQAWRGSVGVSIYRGIISPAYLILKTKPVVDSVYANYLFRSRPLVALYEQCSHGVGSIQRNIYWDELRVQKIPFPPLPEQREIAEYLDRAVSRIDAVVARRKAQLEKLEAFKRSLIQEYVTGKREVRQ